MRAREAHFERLVLPHLDRLLAFAERRVRPREQAEDLVQETYLRAWEAFECLHDEDRVRPWLYQILRSVIADYYRKETRRRELFSVSRLDEHYQQYLASPDESPFDALLSKLSSQCLQDMLSCIPAEYAEAIELHDMEGLLYRDIADVQGVALGTVMSRIARGRRHLAAVILANRGRWEISAEGVEGNQH